MEQTSVEWLEKEISKENGVLTKGFINLLIKQAKEMEKRQIIDAYCHNNIDDVIMREFAEQYYNKTFKQDYYENTNNPINNAFSIK